MKKILLGSPLFLMMAACSTTNSHRLNCEKLHNDSAAKLAEMEKVFATYQDISYDLAVKLTPALKEEADQLDVRIRKQKQRCWQNEHRPIDSEIALLREELFKTYGDSEPAPVAKKHRERLPASVVNRPKSPPPPPMAPVESRPVPGMVPPAGEFPQPSLSVNAPTPLATLPPSPNEAAPAPGPDALEKSE